MLAQKVQPGYRDRLKVGRLFNSLFIILFAVLYLFDMILSTLVKFDDPLL